MPQKYEYKKSNLTIEREKSITSNHIGKEGFDSLFQGDLYTQSLKQQLEYSTHDIFAERFSKEPIADEQLDKKIGDMHSEIFKGKTLGSMAKGKRVKAAKEKIELQKHLLDEQKLLLTRREDDRKQAEGALNFEIMGVMREHYGEQEIDALREWLVMKKSENVAAGVEKSKAYGVEGALFSNEEHAETSLEQVLKETDKMEPEDFAYQSDAQFVSEFAQKHYMLCRGAAAERLLPVYEKILGTSKNVIPISRVRAKIQMFVDLKQEYEDRMKLISSPYYTLLAEKDLKAIEDDGRDPELTEFLKLSEKLSKSKVGKGRNFQRLYARRLAESQKEQAEKDNAKVERFLSTVEIDSEKTGMDRMRDTLDKKKEDVKKGFKEKDNEFLRRDKVFVPGTILYAMTEKDIMQYDAKLAQILEEGKLEGKEIAAEHLAAIKTSVKKYCDLRREYISTAIAASAVSDLQEGCGCDIQNPEFFKTEASKKLADIYQGSTSKEIVDMLANAKKEFFDGMIGLFAEISNMGYSFAEEKEGYLKSHREEGIERRRKQLEKDIYVTRGVPEEQRTERIEMPSFTLKIDGTEHVFAIPCNDDLQVFLAMENHAYEFTGEEGQEILRLMTDYVNDSMDLEVVDTLYKGEGGDKALVLQVYSRQIKERMSGYMGRINEILIDRVSGYRYALEHRSDKPQQE